MSVRGMIFAEIENRLTALTPEPSVETMPSGDPDVFPAIRIFDDGHQPVETEARACRYELAVSIEMFVQGVDAHVDLNALHARVVAALMTDPPLSGLAETIEDGALRLNVSELASTPTIGAAQDFAITFVTRRGDPAQLP